MKIMSRRKIPIAFPVDKLTLQCALGSLELKIDVLIMQGIIQNRPKISIHGSKIFTGSSVLVLECEAEDYPALFGFYVGIDFLRNNFRTLLRVD